jgi:hypothetical protein
MSKANIIAKLGVLALFLGAALVVQAQSWTYTGSMASRRVYQLVPINN